MTEYLTYSGTDFTVKVFDAARTQLTVFMSGIGETMAEDYGFGWDDRKPVPASPDAIRAAFEHSRETGEPFAVPSWRGCSTIFNDLDAQHAFLFWHFICHVEGHYGFETSDEVDLALRQVGTVRDSGLAPLSVAVLEADLVGNVFLMAGGNDPAINRVRFASDVLAFGLVDAISLERQRQQIAAA